MTRVDFDKIYDTVIIGGGPAGYTAALYAVRAGLDTLLIEKYSAGGQMTQTATIENYPGFDEVDGFTLGEKMKQGAERFGALTLQGEVVSAALSQSIKTVVTDAGSVRAKTVIIATGAEHRHLGIEHEDALIGRGVGYCAACDGMLYRGKTVAVVGGGNSAVADALYLSNICKQVYLIHRRDKLRASKIYLSPLEKAENITLVYNSRVTELLFERKLSGAVLTDKDGKNSTLELDGLFISIGRRPETDMFASELSLDEQGYIIADETTKTNIDGVFAAGDVRTKALRQIVTAASDGAVAAHFAEEYLNG